MIDKLLAPYDYDLPDDRIAVHPLENRSQSKMLVLPPTSQLEDSVVTRLPEYFEPGDVLVLNNTKVLQARVEACRSTGGRVELFFLSEHPDSEGAVTALVKPSRRLKEGEVLNIVGSAEGSDYKETVELVQSMGDGEWRVRPSTSTSEVMDAYGSVPIPPYLRRKSVEADQDRYQTVFATERGAVAAPTAGLHFTSEILQSLKEKGVSIQYITLHVGIGTFRNLREEDLERNALHSEWFSVPRETMESILECRRKGQKVFACGTTVTRCLESLSKDVGLTDNLLKLQDKFPISGYTNIFIREGFGFSVVDGLLTNFHLPKSSLLMLVSAFAGRERVLEAYRHAIEHRYRFFSYGDAMLLLPNREQS